MSQFDTQKLYDLLNTLQPKVNYLFLNDPQQNSRFEDYWDDDIETKYEQSRNLHGDLAHRNLIALITRDSETEIMQRLVDAIPATSELFGKPITEEDRYHCRIIFINIELKAFFGIGLGRKTRVFEKGPFDADGAELEGGIDKFSEIDWSRAISTIHEYLIDAGSAIDELANGDWDDDEEIESLEEAVSESLADLSDYLDLDVDDVDNDNH
jgi:hypothetical protein